MSETREKILLSMARLIEKQGYHATGLNEIIKDSGAPKGSLYYFFPDGKEQIGVEAIKESGKMIAARLRMMLRGAGTPAETIHTFLGKMADSVETTRFGAGSPLTTAAVETAVTNDAINKACRDAFDLVMEAFKDKFIAHGMDSTRAADLAAYVTSVIEGGILLSRTYRNADPLRLVGRHLRDYLTGLAL
jgi:TetR/AcrR family transcriptional repressor of lmrAB and yxaGH operons